MVCISKKWLGNPVKVELLDHSENLGKVIPINLYGILAKISRTQITIRSWDAGEVGNEYSDCHTDFYIVRSAITKFTPLKSARSSAHEK